jgi:multidrug efflux pump subunit AcrA (membrane-fusion protein)
MIMVRTIPTMRARTMNTRPHRATSLTGVSFAMVSYVDPKIDSATRTAQVRIKLANPGQMFKIGMYVKVAFATLGGAEKTMPVISKDAVQTIGNQQYVFVATDKPNEFVLRPVKLAPESKGLYLVMKV